MFVVVLNAFTQRRSEKPTVTERGGDGETRYRFTTEITEHILIIVLHSVSVMGLSFVILTAATLQGNQGNQATLAMLQLWCAAKMFRVELAL